MSYSTHSIWAGAMIPFPFGQGHFRKCPNIRGVFREIAKKLHRDISSNSFFFLPRSTKHGALTVRSVERLAMPPFKTEIECTAYCRYASSCIIPSLNSSIAEIQCSIYMCTCAYVYTYTSDLYTGPGNTVNQTIEIQLK